MINNFFASIFSDYRGYNVCIIEIDKSGDSITFKLHESQSSSFLSIQDIADIIKPFVADNFMACYFNFVEGDNTNFIPNGVTKLIDCSRIFLQINENPLVPLQTLTLKINQRELLIKDGLSSRVISDHKNTKPDDMSHQIANLIHVADNWNMLSGKVNIEIRSSGSSRMSDSDSLEGFLGVDRYYR